MWQYDGQPSLTVLLVPDGKAGSPLVLGRQAVPTEV